MYDVVIAGARVVDGSGAPAFAADVALVGDRIVRVGTGLAAECGAQRPVQGDAPAGAGPVGVDAPGPGVSVIDGRGLCLCPGFIDPHTHSDLTLLADPRAESRIRQGVTTEVVGNCGSSSAPLAGAAVAETLAEAAQFGVEVDWADTAGYLERLRTQGTAVNVVTLTGHSNVRGSVLGYGDVRPTRDDLRAMERLAAAAAGQGARGLSSGLFYPPGSYARPDEVAALARAAGGVYASHIRDEGGGVLAAIEEAIAIGEAAGVPVEVSHIKLSGPSNWALLESLMAAVEASAERAVPVGFDQYPYTASGTWLIALLPYPDQQGGAATVARRLTDSAVRARLHADYHADRHGWEERSGVADWAGVVVGSCPGDPEASGRSLAELGEDRGLDPLDVAFDLIVASEGQVDATYFDQTDDVVAALIAHPRVAIGSDGSSVAPDGPLAHISEHPRSYGTFPRVLGHYVRELGILTLEEAVRKMTSLTAERFGLLDRGVVRAGAWADLVLFDPVTVIDRATHLEPARFPDGIACVLVNGRIVLRDGARTQELPGRVL